MRRRLEVPTRAPGGRAASVASGLAAGATSDVARVFARGNARDREPLRESAPARP